ncbi:MAG: hypothetical protein ACFFDI_22550, partial [Promethearchaeota archaeon]
MTSDQVKTILERIENNLVITIAARGVELLERSVDLLGEYLDLIHLYQNFTFCIVAGHPTYKDSVDTRVPSIQALNNVFIRIREVTDIPVFLGAENLSSKTINQLCEKYKPVIPFLLHGDKRAIQKNGINSTIAVYSPIAHMISQKEAIQAASSYLLRRKTTQKLLNAKGLSFTEIPLEWDKISLLAKRILEQSFDQYVLNSNNFQKRTKKFTKQGAQLIVGHPITSGHYSDLIEGFRLNYEGQIS